MTKTEITFTGIALACCMAAAAAAQEVKVKANEVPAPVRAAASKAYPAAQVKGWEKDVEDGKTLYEATMTQGGSEWQVAYTGDGTFDAREEKIAVAALPAAALDAVRAKYPKAVIHSAEKITRATGIEYEAGLKNAPKKEVVLTAEGKILKEE